MQNLTFRFAIALAMLAAWLSASTASTASANTTQFHAAIQAGQVSIRIEFLGGAMGDRMKVFLRKQIPEPLRLSVTPGTVFVPQGADVQRLAAVKLLGQLTAQGTYRRTAMIELDDASERGFLIQIVCIDYHKNSPPVGQAFRVGEVDPRCQRILSLRADLSIWAYQSAIWMDRAGVSADKLMGNFKVPAADIESARVLLQDAERVGTESLENVDVSAEAKTAARGVFSADPAVRVKAYAEIQTLSDADRARLEQLLKQNLLRGGKLPSLEELRAGNTLATLLPEGVTLPKLELPESVDDVLLLVEAIRDRVAEGRASESERLAAAANLRVMPHLMALKSRLPLLRLTAARALPNVKSEAAVEALIVTLQDPDPRVRTAAAEGLQKLTGQSLGEDSAKWSTWWQDNHATISW